MKNRSGKPWMTLAVSLAAVGLLTACDDGGLTDVPMSVDAQFAPGGRGGGGNGGNNGNDPPPITIDLDLAMYTEATQAGFLGADTKNNLEVLGAPAGCVGDAVGDECFRAGLALGADVDDGVPAHDGSADACQAPDGMLASEKQFLFNALTDTTQARWMFEVDISKRHNDGSISTFWYEDGDPDRFSVVHAIDNATVDGSGEWTLSGGIVRLYRSPLGPLECPWTGTITMTIGAP